MNRSTLAVVLVGLLVVQGSVAGLLVDDAGVSNASNTTENATTAPEPTTAVSPEHATGTAGTTEGESPPVASNEGSSNPQNASTTSPTTTTTENGTTTDTTTDETTTTGTTTTETTTGGTTTGETTTEGGEPTTAETTTAETTTTTTTPEPPTTTTTPEPPTTTGTTSAASPTTESPTTTRTTTGGRAGGNGGSTRTPPAAGAGTPQTGSPASGGATAGASSARGAAASRETSGRAASSGAASAGASSRTAGASSRSGATAGASRSAAAGTSSGAGSATGASAASPDAEFSVVSVSSDVPVGDTGSVSITIENTGEDATNAVVNLQSMSGDLLFGQSPNTSRYVGEWEEGETKTIDVTMRATSAADTTAYPVRATVSYEDSDGNHSQSGPLTFGVTPDAASTDLSVVSVSSDVPVGGTGNVSVTLENTVEDASSAVVNLQSMSGDLLFGRSPNTSRYVGEWDAGETKTVEVTMRAARTADTNEYPIRATVSYEDGDGNAARLGPATAGVAPDGAQEFALGGVSGDLTAGESGTISGTVTNRGPKTATDAVLAFSPNGSRDVIPRQSQYVLGSLDPDETESFDLPVFVNTTTEPGERQVPFVVQYYDADGNPLRSETLNARVTIGDDRDDFAVVGVDSDVESGEDGTLSVTMNNTGENVTDTTVSFQSLSGSVVFGRSANASQYVEDWDVGDRRTFEFDVTASDGTAGGTYPMQASLRYTDSDGDRGRSGPFAFGVTPDEGQDDFSVVSSSSAVQVGDEGPISVTLENTGENASAATVSLQSLTGDITFGRAANATQFVGEWPAGTRRTVTFDATASNATDTRSYPFRASVSYDDSDGDQSRVGPFTVGVTPQPEQEFAISNTDSTLRVGEEGNVTARITNRGPQNARNAVVRLVSQSQNVEPQETEAAVGSLAAGASANVSFPVAVTEGAEAGQRQFSFVVEYDNQNGDTRRSNTLDAQVAVAPQRDSFVVERANASLDAGSSGTVTLNVTNNRGTTVRNVNAKAFVDDPLSIASDEAYIARLEPGESQQIAFDVSAGGSASEGEYPLSVDFQYDTADGESQLSETYEVPVGVVASDGGGILSSLSVMVGLGALLVLFGVGWVWSRR